MRGPDASLRDFHLPAKAVYREGSWLGPLLRLNSLEELHLVRVAADNYDLEYVCQGNASHSAPRNGVGKICSGEQIIIRAWIAIKCQCPAWISAWSGTQQRLRADYHNAPSLGKEVCYRRIVW